MFWYILEKKKQNKTFPAYQKLDFTYDLKLQLSKIINQCLRFSETKKKVGNRGQGCLLRSVICLLNKKTGYSVTTDSSTTLLSKHY